MNNREEYIGLMRKKITLFPLFDLRTRFSGGFCLHAFTFSGAEHLVLYVMYALALLKSRFYNTHVIHFSVIEPRFQ
jgi:hypothetical protein